MLQLSMLDLLEEGSLYSVEDSPASPSPLLGSAEERKMIATSSRICLELLHKRDPLLSLLKTCLASSHWHSTIVSLRWKASATPRGHLLFRLVASVRSTEGSESLSSPRILPTPTTQTAKDGPSGAQYKNGVKVSTTLHEVALLPTPRANKTEGYSSPGFSPTLHQVVLLPAPNAMDAMGPRSDEAYERAKKNGGCSNLKDVVPRMLPTPVASQSHKKTRERTPAEESGGHGQCQVAESGEPTGRYLNPVWVELLMGFPEGWTDITKTD